MTTYSLISNCYKLISQLVICGSISLSVKIQTEMLNWMNYALWKFNRYSIKVIILNFFHIHIELDLYPMDVQCNIKMFSANFGLISFM